MNVRFRITSLQTRLILFLLLPVAILLFTVGGFGWYFVRNTLLDQWREAAVLKVQRAAHFIDMRLGRPLDWIEAFNRSGAVSGGRFSQEQILEQLNSLEGVVRAEVHGVSDEDEAAEMVPRRMGMGRGQMGPMMRFARGRISRLTLPEYNAEQGTRTVELASDLLDESGRRMGRLEVEIRFDALLKDIFRLGWWQSETGYLTDADGRFLLKTGTAPDGRKQLGETGNSLETRLLEKMKAETSGTVLGDGYPPEQVAGFCRTETTGWFLVLMAPGKEVLAPVIRFRNVYFLSGIALVLLVLVLIRFSTGKMVRSVSALSKAADKIARGDYVKSPESASADEFGRLTRSFNQMVEGLKERDFVYRTFGRYVDHHVARRLLRRPEASRLGGVKREVAILISDIRGFTPMAEALSPETTIRVLNHYFAHMIRVVERHEGIIVDFFGDSVLVFFDPFDAPIGPAVLQAVRCGLEMQQEMNRFGRETAEEGLPVLEMGIGIHAGEVVVGNIGSETRAKYGIVGTAVNLTQRIQAQAEGGQVLVSEPVVRHAKDCLMVERAFEFQLKGIREPVRLSVVTDCTEPGDATDR
jgi:class 3 adenylate cyclase